MRRDVYGVRDAARLLKGLTNDVPRLACFMVVEIVACSISNLVDLVRLLDVGDCRHHLFRVADTLTSDVGNNELSQACV